MSKIICDVCGTSYPDTAAQCPICGCVRPGEARSVMSDSGSNESSGYNYVKGGRFSKSNVRKRNKSHGGYDSVSVQQPISDEPEERDNKGLVIAVIVLLLAVVAVLVYLSVQFFLPGADDSTTLPSQSDQTSTSESTTLEIPCEKLTLDVPNIIFDKLTTSRIIYPVAEPKNTTDSVVFKSSDEAVVTVDENGLVTPVGPGQAMITVTCGEVVAQCPVECIFEIPDESTGGSDQPVDPPVSADELVLNRRDITFGYKGESWVIYSGKIDPSLILWSSDNEAVAAIVNGKVTAIGNGETTVYAEYGGKTVSCIIRCSFNDSDSSSGSGGNITEDGSGDTDGESYHLKNTVGNSTDDVTLGINTSFTMQLVNSSGNKVQGVVWTVAEEAICTVADGTVTAVSSGITTVTASYKGVEYSFIVRVN